MEILKLIKSKPFKYLWLKKVNGVDLTQHCAKCLIGEYDNRLQININEYNNLSLDGSIYYLCGVSTPYVWKNNFHLAFRESKGKKLIIDKLGIYIEIKDAEEIKFSYGDINFNLMEANKKEFSTCRNWQFANKFLTLNSK